MSHPAGSSPSTSHTELPKDLEAARRLTDSSVDEKKTKRNQSTSDVSSNDVKNEGTQPSGQDGDLRAWLRVLGCFLVLANTMGIQSSFGGFQSYYEMNLLRTFSSSEITWIGTVQIFFSSTGGLLTGPLFDKGYDKLCILVGCFFAVLAYMMLSLSTQYYQIFLAQGVCGGLSGMFVFAPALALTATSFQKRRSLATGIVTGGFTFGAVIYPIVFRRLVTRIGFPWTCRVIAFIALACFLIAYPLVYWRTPRDKSSVRKLLDLKAWKEPPYAVYCWAVFFMYAGYWPPYFYMTTYSNGALGTSLNLAFYIFAISNAANTVARFTATLLADRFGTIEVLTIASFVSAVVVFCWAAVKSSAGMIVWSIFWGYFSGIMSACFAAVIPSLSPSPSVVGTRLGMLNGLFGIGSLVSAPIAGAIISAQGNQFNKTSGYLGAQMFTAACLTTATVLFIYPLLHLRRVGTK